MNQLLTENTSRHAVYVQRYAGALKQDFLPFVKELKKEIAAFVVTNDYQAAKLQGMMRQLTSLQTEVYNKYNQQLILDLEEFGVAESGWEGKNLNKIIPPNTTYMVNTPIAPQVVAALRSQPLIFPGSNTAKMLEAFIEDWSTSEITKVNNIIQSGYIMGKSNREMIKDVNGYMNKTTLRNNEAIVRTSTNHMSTTGREITLQENDDLVVGYRWLSVLDGRTSSECRSLDNQVFLKSDKYQPKPPFHPNCRSQIIAELSDEIDTQSKQGERKAKGDDVGATTTYYGWLKKQTAQFQDKTIGSTRGKLLRNGGITSEQFALLNVDEKFKPLSLQEMKDKDPQAFEQAGIEI